MRFFRALAAASLLAGSAGSAAAHHVDPFEVVQQIYEKFKNGASYPETRAMFSRLLRDAAHDGKLDADFGIVYAMYSDLTRYDGNPAFALQLADEGLALLVNAPQPDEDMKNSLLVSRAYALAELGRYQEAIDSVTITAVWMGERFGEKNRTDLEAAAKGWAEAAGAGGASLPSAVQLSVDLLNKAQDAYDRQDTQSAIMLASRGMLPEGTNLEKASVAFQNARAQMILGTAYAFEGRGALAMTALRRAADLLAGEPWDGKSKAQLLAAIRDDRNTWNVPWSVFSQIAGLASAAGQMELSAAALDTADEFATSPDNHFLLLSQRAALALGRDDFAGAQKTFADAEAQALASGDARNAALSRFYSAVAKLQAGDGDPAGPDGEAVLKVATAYADLPDAALQNAEYALTTAVRMVVDKTGSTAAAMPYARRAFEVFRQRQQAYANYDAAQESGRRSSRRFLEVFIGGAYDEANPPQ